MVADVREALAVGGDVLPVGAAVIPCETRCHDAEYQPVRDPQAARLGLQGDQVGEVEGTEVGEPTPRAPALIPATSWSETLRSLPPRPAVSQHL